MRVRLPRRAPISNVFSLPCLHNAAPRVIFRETQDKRKRGHHGSLYATQTLLFGICRCQFPFLVVGMVRGIFALGLRRRHDLRVHHVPLVLRRVFLPVFVLGRGIFQKKVEGRSAGDRHLCKLRNFILFPDMSSLDERRCGLCRPFHPPACFAGVYLLQKVSGRQTLCVRCHRALRCAGRGQVPALRRHHRRRLYLFRRPAFAAASARCTDNGRRKMKKWPLLALV